MPLRGSVEDIRLNMRIAVLGTGANGSCTAADLARSGQDVVLVDQWPAHVEAMRAHGLRIVMPEETITVPVRAYHLCDLAATGPQFDVVFLMMKAYDTRWACEFIKPYLHEEGIVVGIQNGMKAGEIAEVVGTSRTIGCVVELSSEIFRPGQVQRNTPPSKTWFGIGSLDPQTDGRLDEIQAILRHAGRVDIVPDVLAAKWMKLVVNAMCLGPFAMLGLPVQEATDLPGMRELILRIGAEALEAGQALGYTVRPIMGLKEEDVRGSNQLLEKLVDKVYRDLGPRARDCVLQDHLKGRYSEVDLINGLVVDEAARRGRQAPANAAIVEITRRIRSGQLKPEPSNFALVRSMLD
jgi:2-dehydropantoate 2-reductase